MDTANSLEPYQPANHIGCYETASTRRRVQQHKKKKKKASPTKPTVNFDTGGIRTVFSTKPKQEIHHNVLFFSRR